MDMNRRAFLQSVAAGATLGVIGCGDSPTAPGGPGQAPATDYFAQIAADLDAMGIGTPRLFIDLDRLDANMAASVLESAAECCHGDDRAMPQLALLALANRHIGYAKVRNMLTERFQRDVLADLEYRLSWVYTVIKAAPMVGLLGTVIGMMGAFYKLGSRTDVSPDVLAQDIMLALITTACGLAIAIPLVLSTASINVRIRKMEDLVSSGLTRFLESFRSVAQSEAVAGD